jgi:hypothetical protein
VVAISVATVVPDVAALVAHFSLIASDIGAVSLHCTPVAAVLIAP